MAIVTVDKVNFREKYVTRNNEGLTIIKLSIHQQSFKILEIETDKTGRRNRQTYKIILKDFNTPFS